MMQVLILSPRFSAPGYFREIIAAVLFLNKVGANIHLNTNLKIV